MRRKKEKNKIAFFLVIGVAFLAGVLFSYGSIAPLPATVGHTWNEIQCDSRMCISSSGVGIGTTDTGSATLAVMGGNVGIGTRYPATGLHLYSDIIGNDNPQLRLENSPTDGLRYFPSILFAADDGGGSPGGLTAAKIVGGFEGGAGWDNTMLGFEVRPAGGGPFVRAITITSGGQLVSIGGSVSIAGGGLSGAIPPKLAVGGGIRATDGPVVYACPAIASATFCPQSTCVGAYRGNNYCNYYVNPPTCTALAITCSFVGRLLLP